MVRCWHLGVVCISVPGLRSHSVTNNNNVCIVTILIIQPYLVIFGDIIVYLTIGNSSAVKMQASAMCR